MRQLVGATLLTALMLAPGSAARADDAKDILDKAIAALGGEAKLSKLEAYSIKAKGTITFNDNDNKISTNVTVKGLDHYRSEFEGDFGGNQVKGVTVLNGDKGWRMFGDNSMEMDGDAIANEKRTIYLQTVPIRITPLKGQGFKVETAGEEKVGDKPAAVLKVTGPDGKDFKLFFDKESGLPVKLVAKVVGFNGDEFTQESSFKDYKDFGGIKKATRMVVSRDGEPFVKSEVLDFKALESVDSNLFNEPK